MARDPRACLADALQAADAIADFCEKQTFRDYKSNRLLQSAVERQFMIVGEALAQLGRIDAELADRIPERARIVAFRNILVHGYAVVDDEQVWSAVETHLPRLRNVLTGLLDES